MITGLHEFAWTVAVKIVVLSMLWLCHTRWLCCDNSAERLNVSVYDELASHHAAVLGEIDSGAELTVAGLYNSFLPFLSDCLCLMHSRWLLNKFVSPPYCMLAVSHAAPCWVTVSMLTE